MSRLNYRVRHFPDAGTTQDVTIVITEAQAGAFNATTADTGWILILDVTALF